MADLIDRQQALALRFTHAINEDGVVYVQYREYQNGIVRLPSANCQQVTGKLDCISRQAAIDALEKVAELYPWRVPGDRDSYSQYNEAWQDALNRADGEIEALPSAEPKQKKGKWERVYLDHVAFGERPSIFYCSSCNQCVPFPTNFCPACGSDNRQS